VARMSKGDIFLVDDNPNNLTLLYGILRNAGYQVRAANNGRRALDTVSAYPPELVMLDINMPEMTGYEVCERLKASSTTRDIPVIFISALDDVFDKVRAFEVGGVDYVAKPFQAEEVLARVETQLNLFRLRRDLESKRLELEAKQQALEDSNRELERQNLELARKNEELERAQARTNLIFSALSEALPGTVLDDKYRLDEKIGAGGFGAVYRATHLTLDRPVAIKVLRPSPGNDSPEAVERFRQEALSASRLSHPNAVTVIDFGVSAVGIAYLVMELLEGRTLKEVLNAEGSLLVQRCAEILIPVCEALAEAHAANVVHRDVKPDNIFLHETDGGEVVKVVDFGIAKLFGEGSAPAMQGMTETGVILGTPDYMAPERLSGGRYDGRSDVYSVGVLLFQMVTGKFPFKLDREAGPYAIALRLMTEEPIPLAELAPDAPTEVGCLVARALAKDPMRRSARLSPPERGYLRFTER
jgi:DNA-binding response OmpR family regulator